MSKFDFKNLNLKELKNVKINKKHIAYLIAAVVVIAIMASFVAIVALPSVKNASLEAAKEELFGTAFSFPESGVITSQNGFRDNDKNSLLYVKSALQNGASCVEVDVCFSENGTPFVSDSAQNIDDNTMPLEYLVSYFSDMHKNSESRYYLNMHLTDASNLKEIDEIVKKHNMQDFCFYTGVDINRAKHVKESSTIPFYLNYELKKSKINNPDYIKTVFSEISSSGAVGINCSADVFSSDLASILKENWMKISFYDVETEIEIINSLKYSPNQVITENTEDVREILIQWNANAPSSDIVQQ